MVRCLRALLISIIESQAVALLSLVRVRAKIRAYTRLCSRTALRDRLPLSQTPRTLCSLSLAIRHVFRCAGWEQGWDR